MANTSEQLVICIKNEGYSASLETRKIYVALRDSAAEKQGQLRIIDESGGDYLFLREFLCMIELPQSVKRAMLSVV
jgi:hypothetical protein